MAITYEQWADHYGYEPESEQAAQDWELYQQERQFAESLFADADDQPEPGQ